MTPHHGINRGDGHSITERIATIIERHPQLATYDIKHVTIVAIKDPGYVDVFLNGEKWQRFAFTAHSGTSGPKLQEGDRQIPEGFYRTVALNPNSAYYLSIKINYPNAQDKIRSQALGISDFGSDIYIHGKDASIGCIAIGDDAIEQLFYVVHRCGLEHVEVLISPVNLLEKSPPSDANPVLYDQLKNRLAQYY